MVKQMGPVVVHVREVSRVVRPDGDGAAGLHLGASETSMHMLGGRGKKSIHPAVANTAMNMP